MLRSLYISLLILLAGCAGCENHQPGGKINEVKHPIVRSGKLQTRLGANTIAKDPILISFTIINDADTLQRFCKWETPFEPVLGKYFEIIDDHGNEATFRGAMARRVMPPPPESYIEVPPHDSVRTVYNLAKNYSMPQGQYTVRYTGGGVSGLEAGNEIRITVADLPVKK